MNPDKTAHHTCYNYVAIKNNSGETIGTFRVIQGSDEELEAIDLFLDSKFNLSPLTEEEFYSFEKRYDVVPEFVGI